MNKDHQLIALIKSGDKQALEKVYLRYKKEFILFSRRFSLPEEDVTDIYQDSVIALYENICSGKLDALAGSLKTYLFAIGKYKIYNVSAVKQKFSPVEVPDWEPSEEMEMIGIEVDQERQMKLQLAYRGLGKKCQEVLGLFYYEGLSLDEIKARLNYTSKDVLKSQKSRCIKQLKKLIESP